MSYISIGILEERRDAKVRQLRELGPVLQGSIRIVKATCGKASCKCAKGEKHESIALTKKVNGKTKSVYIPKDMADEAKQWVKENQKLRKLQKEISAYNEQILKLYVQTKRARQKNLKALNLDENKTQSQ
jgi:uncharacterized protein YlxW (UPF0749 family)